MDDCITCTKPDPFPTKSGIAGVLGFCAGFVAAWWLPPIGFYIGVGLGYPIVMASYWFVPESTEFGEEDLRGWWVVIIGITLQGLFYALMGLLLARKLFSNNTRRKIKREWTPFDGMQDETQEGAAQ